MWTLLSPSTYTDLVTRCGWSEERFVAFLSEQLEVALLAPLRSRSRRPVKTR
jgi:hypothetical protein